jgi:NCS2 family nucleobase:cation symporter-2/xanthine permease XanP
MGSEGLSQSSLLYRLTDRLPVRATFLVAIQHVLAMFVGVITVPLLVAHSLNLPRDETGYLISMGLVASGLGTMVQVRGIGFFGSRLLAVQGTSFAFLVPLIQAGQVGGLALMLGMSLLCAPVELVLALFLTRLQRLFTPLVSGTVVLLIGLSLIPVGFKTMAAGLGGHSPAWAGLAVAGLVVTIVFGLNTLRSPWARIGAIPIALGIGYLLCFGLGVLPVDTSGPGLEWVTLPQPLKYGLNVRWEFLLAFLLPYVLTTLETLGDVTATSQLSDEPIEGPIYWRRVRGGVLGDSLNTMMAALINSFPSTTFAQNNGVIQLTGVAARTVGLWVGGLLCILGLVPWIGHWIALLPGPVLGAVTFLLFGFVAAAGIRILQRVQLGHRELLILAFSLAVGVGVQSVPEFLNPLPEAVRLVFSSGITTGGIAAFILNGVLSTQPRDAAVNESSETTAESVPARPSKE